MINFAQCSGAAAKVASIVRSWLFKDMASAEAANTVHREAHGLVADEIFEVTGH